MLYADSDFSNIEMEIEVELSYRYVSFSNILW